MEKRKQEEPIRVRLPRGKEVMGFVEEFLGASRFRVRCKDGYTRMCRLPGKFRRRFRMSVGDAVIIEPWDVQPNEKGDVIWIYNKTQLFWLKKHGHMD